MQLSRLEIKGFKSFGDRITINFDEGITGIVGPNGCGKSNIVDAIRWVLGEQKSRMLRSDKMENIIFNGTKTRKPTQLAEVSLTFNNTRNVLPTEYSEVTVTRKYYRSGDSEYLLNGVTCRLKDITNLFLDTGIASNTYAIIELKMVDDLLNDKDNSRRALFEEAAGISKFKIRKKETLRKLEDTDADLERVEDLLFEIDKNMKSLERQARQAQRYFKSKEEYQHLSIAYSKKTVLHQKESYDQVKTQLEAENDRKLSLSTQIKEKEALVEQAKKELIEREKLLGSRQKALNEHVAKIRQYESEKKIKNERLRFLNDKLESLKDQLSQDRKSNERASFSIQSLSQEKSSAEKILAEMEVKLAQLKDEYDSQKARTQSLREEHNTLSKIQKNEQDEVYQLNKSVEIKEIQLSSLKQELEKTSTDNTHQTANLAEFDQKIQEVKSALDQRQELLENIQGREDALQERMQSVERTLEMIRDEMNQTNRKLDARQNEYNLTKSLVDNLEGFPEAIKFLRKQSSWGKQAVLLSDVITCPEDFRVAIENFIEPYMNYYVVENESQAYQAVNLLSDASKGKAHFFILDSFENFHPTASRFFDNATPATEIVEYDSKYRKLVSSLLDNVFVVQGPQDQIPADHDCTFITRSGKVIKRKNSISGGSVGLFEGKRIGRARNLEKLQKEIKELTIKINNIRESQEENQNELASLKGNTQRDQISQLQREINTLQQDYVSIKTKQEQFNEMLSSTASKKEDINLKIGELIEELEALKPLSKEKSLQLEEHEAKSSAMNDELQNQNDLLSIKSAAFNQENIQFHQQQNKISSLDQELSYKQNTFESSKERIEKNQEELAKTEQEINNQLNSAEIKEDELVSMYREKESIETGVNEAEKNYYAQRGSIDEFEKEAREIQRKREQIDTILLELQNQQNEIRLQINSVKERLSVEFNLDLDNIIDQAIDENLEGFAPEELKEKVVATREKMEKMGPINPMAMEAYEEIKERNDFISGQKEDLIKAKESLTSTISEIDLVAKETFMEAYEKIKDNFITVFRTLFTDEDDCALKLTNPEDPLDSRIEIIAKPKGKRPLTINQLSGGEKTLTATSLLFAIYLLKPAPFCIFDEVDAPLDDANIDKFNNIIKKFSKESQFIIVTHNKRTMTSTDVIYGITMQEQGVSKVVPVDLRALAS